MKTVGVIGGMGPAATVDFFRRLVEATPAARDQDHLHIIINNDPTLPDRNRAIAGIGPSPGPAMASAASALQRAGADFLVIACNTAHAFLADVHSATALPVIDMVAATVATVKRDHSGSRAVGLLAVDGCLEAGLYQRALLAEGLSPVRLSPKDQATFMALIYSVKAGDAGPGVRAGMRALTGRLIDAGADLVIAACTEVPMVLDVSDLACTVISSTDVLVRETIVFAGDTIKESVTADT